MRRSTRVTGLLAALACAAFPAAAGASSVYVANSTSSSISAFAIGTGGEPTPIPCAVAGTCETGLQPLGIAVDPTGRHLYTVNSNAASISVFSIAADGGVANVACDVATACKAGVAPFGVAVDPTGRFVYTTGLSPAAVSVYAIGADGALTPVACDPATACKTGASPEALAIDPSGRYVYVVNRGADSVSVFAIGATGALTPVACASGCVTNPGPAGIAITPDGQHVYVSSINSSSISVFATGAGGVLNKVPCDFATICKTGVSPQTVAVDPSGSHVYAINGGVGGAGSVSVFAIGAGGVLAPVTCDPTTFCKTGGSPKGLAVDPIGKHVYVSLTSGLVSPFTVGADGSLSPIPCVPATRCQTGNLPDLYSLAISPDRGPAAAFTVAPSAPGTAATFDASSSSSPDYPVASYAWSFGDGQTQTTASAVVGHVYASAGTYTATLDEVDAAGCATSIVFTGQTASCNGSAKAHATRTVSVVAPSTVPPIGTPPPPIAPLAALTKLRLAPSALSTVARGRTRAGTRVRFTLNLDAAVRFTVQRRSTGRRVRHGAKTTCDRSTASNRRKPSCTRYAAVSGSVARSGRAGANTFRFSGRMNGRRLARGRYRLVAVPTAGGRAGHAVTVAFRVVR